MHARRRRDRDPRLMARTPGFPATPVTITGAAALGIAGAALAASLYALGHVRHSGRLAADVEVASTITDAYQRRAIDCIDLASGWIGRPESHLRARMSLELSRGLTLCLVKAREDARLDMRALSACVAEVEIVNTIIESIPGGGAMARPAC